MSEEFSTVRQIEYPKGEIKEVDTTEIVDFSGTIKGLEDSDGDVNFKNPFYVPEIEITKESNKKTVAEKDMDELVKGIEEFGVLVPLLVRKRDDGKYELLSGYRRKKAVEFINSTRTEETKIKLPIIEVPDCDNDKAIIILTTSNTHRSKITLKEQIKACGLAYRAMRHQGKSSQEGKKTSETVAEMFNLTPDTVIRYSALVRLNDGLLELIGGEDENRVRKRNDDGKIILSRRAGELLSTLNDTQQDIILQFLEEDTHRSINVPLASWINKKFKHNPNLTLEDLRTIVEDWKKSQLSGNIAAQKIAHEKITFDDLQSYFPNKTAQNIIAQVHAFLDKWKEVGSPENFEINAL